jgi:hypothetical protein
MLRDFFTVQPANSQPNRVKSINRITKFVSKFSFSLMKLRHIFLLLGLAILFSACESNPAWDGPKPSDNADKLAYEACGCTYEMLGKEAGIDLSAVMKELKSIRKASKANFQMAVLETESPELIAALQNEGDFSIKMDDCECMKPVQDALLEKGVAFEEMMARLDMHCLLGALYN